MKRGRQLMAVAASGVLFSLGLALGGMTRPSKVLGFLDVTGAWDASLAFVMGGALGVYALGFWRMERWSKPLFETSFHMPSKHDIDVRLVLGAVLFGAGWGLSGFCPGPALVALVTLDPRVVAFVVAMIVSMLATRRLA